LEKTTTEELASRAAKARFAARAPEPTITVVLLSNRNDNNSDAPPTGWGNNSVVVVVVVVGAIISVVTFDEWVVSARNR